MKYYCIGIKGAGMSTLAGILSDLGHEVSGYDDYQGTKFTEEGLKKRNIPIYYEANDLARDTIVTYSKAFSLEHPEIKRVRELGLEIREYNQVVGDITKMFETIGVSGTHGKTTCSLMISHVLKEEIPSSYFIGDGTAKADSNDKLFVIESDEYNKHFLAYHPHVAIITNIEEDHLECYPGGLEEIKETFATFANKANLVIALGDDPNIRDLKLEKKTIYYGFNKDNDVVAKNINLGSDASSFDLYIDNKFISHIKLPFYGRHMILNSLAVFALAWFYKLDIERIKESLSSFPGAKRRFKESFISDIVIIDDYAHHPTEIKVTIEAARQKYPDKDIVAIFLPNTYSRTADLFDDFITSLKTADHVYLMEIESDREDKSKYPGISSKNLADKIPQARMISLETTGELLIHRNSVLIFMSCANISKLLDEYKDLAKGLYQKF